MGIDIYFERVKTNPDGDRYFLIFNSNLAAVTVCGEELKHPFDRTVFMIHSTEISTSEKFQSINRNVHCFSLTFNTSVSSPRQVLRRGPVNIETNRNQFCKDCTIVEQCFWEPDTIQYSTPRDIGLLFALSM